MTPTEEDVRGGEEIQADIDRVLAEPLASVLNHAIDEGLAEWELAYGLLAAAFCVVEKMDNPVLRIDSAQWLCHMAGEIEFAITDATLKAWKEA